MACGIVVDAGVTCLAYRLPSEDALLGGAGPQVHVPYHRQEGTWCNRHGAHHTNTGIIHMGQHFISMLPS